MLIPFTSQGVSYAGGIWRCTDFLPRSRLGDWSWARFGGDFLPVFAKVAIANGDIEGMDGGEVKARQLWFRHSDLTCLSARPAVSE